MKKNVRRVLAALLGVMMILTLSMTAIMAEDFINRFELDKISLFIPKQI